MDAETIIIGTGFGGLAMAHKLKESGRDNLIVLEKADEVGGTWRENTYPGAECDIPSVLYSYSFAPNPSWDFKWAKQPQIFRYLKDFATERELRRHIRFGHTVTGARWDEVSGLWTVETSQGPLECRFLVSAIGQLHHPRYPSILGVEDFAGRAFHSARWDHSVELSSKRIGVIGNAASAVQLIPEVAKTASHLTVYQRTPNWVIDKGDRAYWGIEKWIARHIPSIQKLYRFGLWSLGEYGIYPVIRGARVRGWLARLKAKSDMRKHIKDPKLRETLTPDYPIGAKRILFSDSYYPALARENVELVTSGIARITRDGILDRQGREHAHDVIVFATGFHTNPFLKEIDVVGEQGRVLRDHWADGAHAYNGVMTAGFPNLFLLYGPNTNTGHTSIVYKLEQQVGYILQLMNRAAGGRIAVRPAAEDAFDAEMQQRLKNTAWSQIEASWYKDGDKVTNNWPGPALEFARRLRTPNWNHFRITVPN